MRSRKKTAVFMYIIERIIEMLFIINETIFNSNFGIFLVVSISIGSLVGEIVCRVYSFFSLLPPSNDHFIYFFRLECGQMIVHGTCLIYIFTTQCNNIEQSSEISKWTPSYQIKYEIFWQKKTAPKMKYQKNISYREPIEWIDEYWDGIKWWKQKQNARIENERSNK